MDRITWIIIWYAWLVINLLDAANAWIDPLRLIVAACLVEFVSALMFCDSASMPGAELIVL